MNNRNGKNVYISTPRKLGKSLRLSMAIDGMNSMKKKWAQLTPVERAYERVIKSERGFDFSFSVGWPKARDRISESVEFKRARNRYIQLLMHWKKLKDASTAQNS